MKVLLLFLLFNFSVSAKFIITLRSPEVKGDSRYDYDNELIIKAMEVTVKEFGTYDVEFSSPMSFNRAINTAQFNKIPNLVFKLSYEEKHELNELIPVLFPIDLGVVGYRVCFVNDEVSKKFENTFDVKELKKFLHGQGSGWHDVDILKKNGFEVIESPLYETLFLQLKKGRFHLFCRGINEIKDEIAYLKSNSLDLYLDKTKIFKYDLPRFLYLNKDNKKLHERLTLGINRLYASGELKKLWDKKYSESIMLAKIEDRVIFEMKNPLLSNLKFDYKKYFVKLPTKKIVHWE